MTTQVIPVSSRLASVALLVLAAFVVGTQAAFVSNHDNHRFFSVTRQHTSRHATTAAAPPGTKPKLPGAAMDAQEDLKLTRKVIMDFIKKQDSAGTVTKDAAKAADKVVAIPEPEAPPTEIEPKVDEEETPSLFESLEEAALVVTPTTTKETAAPVEVDREFQFVYDEWKGFTSGRGGRESNTVQRPTISCDSLIPGCDLTLSNWNGNADTPAELYADTSTEMALKLATSQQYAKDTSNALVLSNHYDTGGVLSAFACLYPKLAIEKYSQLLVDGAQAGDFLEWSSDEGIKLHCVITEGGRKAYGEGVAFVTILQDDALIQLLDDMLATGGKSPEYFNMWSKTFAEATTSYDNLVQEKAKLDFFHDDSIVTISRSWFVPPVSPFALHRYLKEQGRYDKVKRIIQVLTDARGARFTYQKPGHGWVPDPLVDRPTIPTVDAAALVEKLNGKFEEGEWKETGLPEKDDEEGEDEISQNVGRIDICQSLVSIAAPLEEVVDFLVQEDSGL
ncbi:expressed unknown protein [Seminavis robusta]|uniref:Uncharacterized protein n=1 Tax=Seminavis robusta TaxID=568900 RepID=A0A9N8DKK4_9STRA|nr:expressed unknown protein [Seminavis robusta]|eukprot:Sro173_g076260.1 n/a (506) ;mRNA; r:31857-33374